MNKKAYRTIIDFFNMMLPLLIVYCGLCITLYIISDTNMAILYSLAFMIVPVLFFIIYKSINNIFLYVLLHLLISAFVVIITQVLSCKIIFGILCFIFICISIKKKVDIVLPQPSSFGFTPSLFIIILSFMSELYATKEINFVIMIAFIAYAIICKYNNYLVYSFIFISSTTNECHKTFNKSKTLLSKMWVYLSMFIITVLTGVAFIPELGIFKIVNNAFFGLCRVIMGILNSLLKSNTQNVPAEETVKTTIHPDIPVSDEVVQKVTEPVIDLRPLYILVFLMGTFVLYLIIISFKYALKDPLNRYEDDDDKEFINPLDKVKSTKVKKKFKFNAIFGDSHKQRIRKIFFTSIINNMDERINIHGSLTPKELCNNTYDNVDKKILSDITDIYENTRYSNNDITFSDYINIKDLAKKI